MLSLTEFLLARIAEDEAMWSLAAEGQLALQVTAPKHSVPAIPTRGFADRRLAECEAKRRIVELHNPCDDWSYGDPTTCPELVALALPFADHPDYRAEEWAP